MVKWCTRYLCEYGFGNGIRFMMCRPSQPYQYDHDTPLWDGALLITLVGTSKEPKLLVAGVIVVTLVMGSCHVGRLCHYYEFQAHRWSLHGCYSPESVLVRRTTCGLGTNRVDLFA